MNIVRPYGDTLDDGKVQLSFTLPVPDGAKGREAARQLVLRWGFKDCDVVHSAPLSAGFSFYVAYGKTEALGGLRLLRGRRGTPPRPP
ncbi:MAG: hypothetical protein MZU97_12565 [Bacillus subtilis]|nr:hypothetical protein [Bacillus subtilis]